MLNYFNYNISAYIQYYNKTMANSYIKNNTHYYTSFIELTYYCLSQITIFCHILKIIILRPYQTVILKIIYTC